MNRHLLPNFGDRKLREITALDLVKFFSKKRRLGYSKQYLRHFYSLLKLIFDIAVEANLVEATPVSARLHRPKVETGEKPTLTPKQIRNVLAHIREEWKALFFCVAVSALRCGELLALRWKNVDWLTGELHITHSLWKRELTTPKTKSSRRTIHMPNDLVAVLRTHRQQSSFTEPDDFIFCRADGRSADPDYLRKRVLYPAMDAAGIRRGKRTHGFHIFRHSAGSIVHEHTGSLKQAQTLLGHSRIDTTADTYVHVNEVTARRGLEILANEISCCPLIAHFSESDTEIVH